MSRYMSYWGKYLNFLSIMFVLRYLIQDKSHYTYKYFMFYVMKIKWCAVWTSWCVTTFVHQRAAKLHSVVINVKSLFAKEVICMFVGQIGHHTAAAELQGHIDLKPMSRYFLFSLYIYIMCAENNHTHTQCQVKLQALIITPPLHSSL